MSTATLPTLPAVVTANGVRLLTAADLAVLPTRGPDAAFICTKSLPVRRSPEGYLETIPELVVEFRSKNDTSPEVEAKVRGYLAAGVELVWVADPDARTVTAHRPNQPLKIFAATDTLTADPVIPGFAVPVAELFRS
jgi:Uma2 family endonuclease